VLVVNLGDDHEKHDQQRREGQRSLEGLADAVLFRDTGEGGGQDDDQQPDQAHFGDVKGQRQHQQDRDGRQDDQQLPVAGRRTSREFT